MVECVWRIYNSENGRTQLPVRALETLHLVFVSKISGARSSQGSSAAPPARWVRLLGAGLFAALGAVYVLYRHSTASRHGTLCCRAARNATE